MKTTIIMMISAAALFISSEAAADKLMAQHPGMSEGPPPQYYAPPPQQSSLNELPNMLVDMFMEQGVVGAMLLVLALYFFRTETQARVDRIKLTDELQKLVRESLDKSDIIEVKTAIASMNSQMTNLEREVETLKDFIISGRIGGNRG
tara:strand:+ start:141 stop:584 length:444 start_codon:yes stop_codon:yes gene_type:complete